MQKKNNTTSHDKHTNDVINDLFGEAEETADIESDVADLGLESEEDVKVVDETRRNKFYFGFAVVVVILAIIGLVTCIKLTVSGIQSLVDNTPLKNELTSFILPAVAVDVTSFSSEEEIPNSAKVNCSIWKVLLSDNYTQYKSSTVDGYNIPEVDVSVACKELFGSDSTLTHQSVGYGESRFLYNAESHVYTCPRNLRNLSYAPHITEMTESDGVYTLTVDYLPPSILMVMDDYLGVETAPDKSMIYTVSRQDKKNTLISVEFPDSVG